MATDTFTGSGLGTGGRFLTGSALDKFLGITPGSSFSGRTHFVESEEELDALVDWDGDWRPPSRNA